MRRTLKALARRVLPPAVIGWLRARRVRRMVGRYVPRTVRHTYAGHPLEIRLTDPLAEGWYDRDWPEQAEVTFLRQAKLCPGATVFDLGAHQGVVALILAREVGPGGRVVAVEANPHNAAACEANARLNAAKNLVVRCAAVADRPGTLAFSASLNGQVDDSTGAWGRVEVPAVTIDQLAAEFGPPDVLFVDVEGFECQALRGAAGTLARHRPDICVEIHLGAGLEKFGSVRELLASLPAGGYEFYRLGLEGPAAVPTPARAEELVAETARFYLLARAVG
jgi:FkbM family methyltransferase